MMKCVIGFILVKRRMASEYRFINFLKSSGRGASGRFLFSFCHDTWKAGCRKQFHQLEMEVEI